MGQRKYSNLSCPAAAALLVLKYNFILLYKGGWGWWKGGEAGIHNGKRGALGSGTDSIWVL